MLKSKNLGIFRVFSAIIIALLIALVIIFMVSEEPWSAFSKFLIGPFSSLRYIGNIVEAAIPMIFTGLAVCVMFSANQFNLGAEGAFFIGAVGATYIATQLLLPIGLHPMTALLVGALAGGIVGALPAILKLKWQASELVSSLMFNFIMFYIGIYIINNVLRDPAAGAFASFKFADTAILSNIISGTRVHVGVIIAIVAVVGTYMFLYKTKWGYALRITGINEQFARYSGVNVVEVILYSQFIGGALAGFGGAVEMLGMYNRFQWQQLPQYGFDGIIVAIIAKKNPAYVPVAAIFLAYLRLGAQILSRSTDVQNELVIVIQAIIIMLVVAEGFLSKLKQKLVIRETKKNARIS